MTQQNIIQTVLNDGSYRLGLFDRTEIRSLSDKVFPKTVRGKEIPHVQCIVRGTDIQLKPEEVVRQLYATRLVNRYGYPRNRLAFEHPILFGREKKRADIVIFDKDRPDSAYVIVELKKPKLSDGKNQLRSYCNATGAPIACGPMANRFPTTTARIPTILKTSATFLTPVRVLPTFLRNVLP